MYDNLVSLLGTPPTTECENFLYFGSFFLVCFFISVIFDLICKLGGGD